MNGTDYLPVDPVFYEVLDEVKGSPRLRIFYFGESKSIEETIGRFVALSKDDSGEFIRLKNNDPVRLDRIIVINGNPGPAFAEYDDYANACLSCTAGYDFT